MGKYIYKLVDKKEVEFAQGGLISLSRPIFEFKGSEGKIVNFVKRINEKFLKNGLKINPSETDLAEIKEWNYIYKETYGKDFEDQDILSESMIMFCGIIQAYCGYFTNTNLFNRRNLKSYLKHNCLKEKIGVIRLDFSHFISARWKTDDINSRFSVFVGDPYDMRGYDGYTHFIDITYTKQFDDYHYLLNKYNKDDVRKASTWFDNIDRKYKWQNEKRVILLLESLNKNSRTRGSFCAYTYPKGIETFEEAVYKNVVDALHYCNKSPKYVYLNVDKFITFKSFEEILE